MQKWGEGGVSAGSKSIIRLTLRPSIGSPPTLQFKTTAVSIYTTFNLFCFQKNTVVFNKIWVLTGKSGRVDDSAHVHTIFIRPQPRIDLAEGLKYF